MPGLISTLLWLVCAGSCLVFALQSDTASQPFMIPMAVLIVLLTVSSLIPAVKPKLAIPVNFLRQQPLLYWLVILLFIALGLGLWVANLQPTNGRMLTAFEFAYLSALAWGFLYLIAYGVNTPTLRMMGQKLGKSKLTGLLVTATTFLFFFIAAETWMRINYITTDAFGFTAMNYHWYQNFGYAQDNSLGFRDYEPKPDAEGLIRVGILGDSFAMGHGINNLDDTFGQILERELGDQFDVDIIAKSGWDTDIQLYNLQQYPLQPDIVVLSYYLNDIDYQLSSSEALNPDRRFSFPDTPILSEFILNFFVPNYIYYNLLQFTSVDRTGNHLLDLVNAHVDEAMWAQQAQYLFEIVNWTRQNNIQMVVLLWPHLTQIEASQPALDQLRTFLIDNDVPFVDMSESLLEHPSTQLIVNAFDTHPGLLAQQLAANALLTPIQQAAQTISE